jgi:hypothetical protein
MESNFMARLVNAAFSIKTLFYESEKSRKYPCFVRRTEKKINIF